MQQNIYDDPVFFSGYQALRANESGLNACLEQPALHSLLPSLQSASVLDLGCGFGDFCRYAVATGAATVTGVDISERMLAAAREKTAGQNVTYFNRPIEEFEYDGPPLDLVVSSLCFHYIADYAVVVARICNWLRPGGRLVFSVEHPMCTALLAGWYCDPEGKKQFWPVDHYQDEGVRHSHWFVDGVIKYHRTLETYVNVLLDSGFTLRRILEPEALCEFVAQRPELAEERRRPPFLIIAAERN